MIPHDLGTLFDELADAGTPTRVHLDRPFDLAPSPTGDGATEWTVPELALLVQETAGALAAAGAGPGDRVAIVKANHWDYDLIACAAVRTGAVPVKLSDRVAPEALRVLLDRCAPTVLVTDADVLRRDPTVDLAGTARTTVVLGPRDALPDGTVHLDELAGAADPGPHPRDDDAPLVVVHTSGTTGVPKLVTHTTRTLIHHLARFETLPTPRIGLRRDDSLFNASSYAHGRTICWTAVAPVRAPRHISIDSQGRPDTADLLLRAHPPTVVEALPAHYVRLRPLTRRLDQPFRDVRTYISTYDAVHPPVIRSYLQASTRRRPLWMQGWGQSETGPLTFAFHTRRSVARAADGTATTARDLGRPVPLKTRLKAVDPDTFLPVPAGTPGLILCRTKALAPDYPGEPERWAAKAHGGWWNTGDIGTIARDGSVRLLDREVDHLPGFSCLQAEDMLEDLLPEALECVVLARTGGAAPLPVVVTEDGTLDPASWKRAADGLPPLAEPAVVAWDEVPRTATGKVRRAVLLEQLTGSAETCGTGRWT
ncbi:MULTISPECIES: class I adenylate-forming enzyme family protein [unclassified Streptomyces]|uniref:class I adenylate-forming enzyme family protein n=1 Tax=unclassified Streptomyces TaxID=2593676 RepID=UPI0019D23290|nr:MULTISPECIES: class I adenylate-forming enzyme family protein [unclassified Streptomyces]